MVCSEAITKTFLLMLFSYLMIPLPVGQFSSAVSTETFSTFLVASCAQNLVCTKSNFLKLSLSEEHTLTKNKQLYVFHAS
jgi:hypothetical protein